MSMSAMTSVGASCPQCSSGLLQQSPKLTRCLACKYGWRVEVCRDFRCEACGYDGPRPNKRLRLAQDGRTDWFCCPQCGEQNNSDNVTERVTVLEG